VLELRKLIPQQRQQRQQQQQQQSQQQQLSKSLTSSKTVKMMFEMIVLVIVVQTVYDEAPLDYYSNKGDSLYWCSKTDSKCTWPVLRHFVLYLLTPVVVYEAVAWVCTYVLTMYTVLLRLALNHKWYRFAARLLQLTDAAVADISAVHAACMGGCKVAVLQCLLQQWVQSEQYQQTGVLAAVTAGDDVAAVRTLHLLAGLTSPYDSDSSSSGGSVVDTALPDSIQQSVTTVLTWRAQCMS
jgi:hypothetical protein